MITLESFQPNASKEARAEVEHMPEVLGALQAAAATVAAKAAELSESGDSAYYYGVDVLPTAAKGYVVTANLPAMHANCRSGDNPLKVAIGG